MGTYKTLVIRDEQLHRALKQHAAIQGVPVVSLVEKFVRDGLERLPRQKRDRRDRGKSRIEEVHI